MNTTTITDQDLDDAIQRLADYACPDQAAQQRHQAYTSTIRTLITAPAEPDSAAATACAALAAQLALAIGRLADPNVFQDWDGMHLTALLDDAAGRMAAITYVAKQYQAHQAAQQ